MDSLLNTVLFAGDLEDEHSLDKRVRFIDGRHKNELLVTVDNKVAASIEFAAQKMVVRDIGGTLIGYYDCPPSTLKREVLSYCSRRHTKATANASTDVRAGR
jgi:hypothetical protein